MTQAVDRFRYRVTFGKQGPLIYTSHLDIARVWERVLRRARVPLMYSQGFNPRPKIHLAAALPLGYASTCELLDMWLEQPLNQLEATVEELRSAAPAGLVIDQIEAIPLKEPALQTQVRWADYVIVLDEHLKDSDLTALIDGILEREEVWRERRKKTVDIRPLIEKLWVEKDEGQRLVMRLSISQDLGSVRPDEVLDEMGLDVPHARITRSRIWFASTSS
ncbi:MAG: DUF2344 domain-containing protein [Chloroflexi bacterium]|nr:DUF2344 domain-containing protein [Chloroflexota bacterium]